MTRLLRTIDLTEGELSVIRRLMDDAFHDFDDDDWQHTIGGWHVLVHDGVELVAHAAVVERVLEIDDQPFRTGYVEGVATAPGRQGEGFGSAAMAEATELIRRTYELGALGTGAFHFYERLGWERWQGRTFVRDGDRRTHSVDDDGAVMVLRFGPSAEVDLAASISCDGRPGDDW